MMKGCDLAVTNVPGPPITLFSAGAEVQAIVPFAPKGGAAANVALMTYSGTAFVGVNIDTRAIPDPDAFLECLRDGFDQILALADPDAHAVVGLHSGTPVDEPASTAPVARKAPARKTAAKKAPARKAPAKNTPAKKTAAKKAPARKAATKKAPAETSAAVESASAAT
jgi:hypothetical protein